MKESDKSIWITFALSIITVISLWILTYHLLIDNDDRGVIGDMFGSINALFSGLALAGIIFTILLQRKELEYQRNELRETRREFEIQNTTLKLQRFENTFFQLLQNHNDIVNGIDITAKRSNGWHVISQGRDCFNTFYTQFKAEIKGNNNSVFALDTYHKFYIKHQSDLGHYFRNLYHIIKFIDRSKEIDDSDKFLYVNLLRALLSSHELSILFYNGLSVNGNVKFKPLIEKYSFLKNLDKKTIPHKNHIELYDKIAFSSSEERNLLLNKNS